MDATAAVLTSRLALTPIGLDDVSDLTALHGDPEVAFWTGPWTSATTTAWAMGMATHWTTEGVGKWIARDRTEGALVGRGGLTRFDLDGESVLEVGWAVVDGLTRRGYATEIGQAALDWAAAHEPGIPIVAFTEIHNRASQAVMRRLGMRPAGVIHREGLMEGRSGMHPDAPFALYRSP